jgi:hypothetical protein
MDKRGKWNVGDAFNLDKVSNDFLLDDKSANKVLGDLKKHMGPNGFPSHKPVISGPSKMPPTGSSARKSSLGSKGLGTPTRGS